MERAVFVLLLALVSGQEYINDVPIRFSLGGSINYTPTSGGVAIPGYILDVGFDRYSWIGVMFMTLTSKSNYDVLIFQRGITPNGGFYPISVTDYFVSSGRPTAIISDSVNNMDLVALNYTNTNYFQLLMDRTKGNTNGQDWEGGEFVEICFFTSDISFDANTWTQKYKSCYGYQISSYVSVFGGIFIQQMQFEGVISSLYGGINGPYLQVQLLWYRPSPSMTNTSSLIIQIGDQISSSIGSDYFVCGQGDFYGSLSVRSYDLSYSGYNDGTCSFSKTSSSTFLLYTRDLYTSDDFDHQIQGITTFCVIGSENNCQSIALPRMFPIQSVSSALVLWDNSITSIVSLLLMCLLLSFQ